MAHTELVGERRRLRRLIVLVCAAVLGGLLPATRASAGVGLGIAPTYPTQLEVGDANIAVSLSVTNTSDGAEAAGTLTVNSIRHTPSCGSAASSPCPAAAADKDVFLLKGPVTGRANTACAGKSFSFGLANATTGEVELIPSGGAVVLQAPGTAGDTCTIEFFVDMLRVPSKDASPSPGTQTAQLARVAATASVGNSNGSSSGAGLVTGSAMTPHIPAPAVSPAVLGGVALLLVAYAIARLRRTTVQQARSRL